MRLRAVIPVAAATMLSAPAAASAAFVHVVAPGESLSSVAASDGVSVQELAAANGLSPEASLLAGSTLTIPPQTTGTAEAGLGETESSTEAGEPTTEAAGSSTEGAASSSGSYVVQPGDTLSA